MTCAVCDRPVRAVPIRVRGGRLLLCASCYGATVTIRTAHSERYGAKTFYVSSFRQRLQTEAGHSAIESDYTVKLWETKRATCTCPDHTHRGQILGVPCKHVRLVRLLVNVAGGASRVPMGATLSFTMADPKPITRRRSTT